MHHIQRTILARLMDGESVRYSDLQPKDIGSNLFTYHLKRLRQEGYLMRTSWGTYKLTSTGKRFVDTLSLETMRPRVQAKIVVLLACRDRLGRWLLMKRKVQPLLGQIGFPYGKMHLGETIHEAAHREMEEKTGLDGKLEHRGDGYITILENKKPVSEIYFHLFYCMGPTGYLKSEHKSGEVFWSDIDDDFTKDPYMASMADLIEAVENTPSGHRFFIEKTYNTTVRS